MSLDLKQAITLWFEELWVHRREGIIDDLLHPDAQLELEGVDGKLSREDFYAYRRAMLNAIPDLRVKVLSIVADGKVGSVLWRATGSHMGFGLGVPPSRRCVDFMGVTILEYRDGKFVHGIDKWNRGEVIAGLLQMRMNEVQAAAGLTPREAEVARLMADRLSHVEIAEQLRIRPNTARRHSERVLLKLGINRRQDVAKALGRIPGSVLARHEMRRRAFQQVERAG